MITSAVAAPVSPGLPASQLVNTGKLQIVTIYRTPNRINVEAVVDKFVLSDGSREFIRYHNTYLPIQNKSNKLKNSIEVYTVLREDV